MTQDREVRIEWLDEHLPKALAALGRPAEQAATLQNLLTFVDGGAADYQHQLSSLIELALASETRRTLQELTVARLLSDVHSLHRWSVSLTPALERLHEALSGTRKRLSVDFAELELMMAATLALEVWSFERADAAEKRNPLLAAFGCSVQDRLQAASGLAFDKGVDQAAAEAGRLARPLQLEVSDEELRIVLHALDMCQLEFDADWDEFRVVFGVRSPSNLSRAMTLLSTRLAEACAT